jgi:hypothetical protein
MYSIYIALFVNLKNLDLKVILLNKIKQFY